MTRAQLTALLAFVAGSATGMTTSALLREAPGEKSYFTTELAIFAEPLADGGSEVRAVAHVDATLNLSDGGVSVVQLPPAPCPLTEARKATLRAILTAAAACARDAP